MVWTAHYEKPGKAGLIHTAALTDIHSTTFTLTHTLANPALSSLLDSIDVFLTRKKQQFASLRAPQTAKTVRLIGDMKHLLGGHVENSFARPSTRDFDARLDDISRIGNGSMSGVECMDASSFVGGGDAGDSQSVFESMLQSAPFLENPSSVSFSQPSDATFAQFGGGQMNFSTADNPFSPSSEQVYESSPFSLKSGFKIKSYHDASPNSGATAASQRFLATEDPFCEMTPPTELAAFVDDCPFDSEVPAGLHSNLLDEVFDISGHDFSPANSGSNSPRHSEISNLSIKSDDYILGNSRNASFYGPGAAPLDRAPLPVSPIAEVYQNTHPTQTLGTALYRRIVSGGMDSNAGGEDEDAAKTPMSKYFAEKSGKLGGKLGQLVDLEERPFFNTPKRDRTGKIVDEINSSPQVEEGRVRKMGPAKPTGKKPLYIRSPALGNARYTVKWKLSPKKKRTSGGKASGSIPNQALTKRNNAFVASMKAPKSTAHTTTQQRTEPRQYVAVTRKPLYQPPPPRTEPREYPATMKHKHQSASSTRNRVSPLEPIPSQFKNIILHEITFPSSGTGLSSAPVRTVARKLILIPAAVTLHVTNSKHRGPHPRTYIRLQNPALKDAPFHITAQGGGTRDGKPCTFFSSFKLDSMKGVVEGNGGVLDVEVKISGVLRGTYVQSFRVFANRGSVPVTLKAVV
ncbi:hypothetical protein BJ741DRAFT_64664 [Chytriomyces cf. hyalinus JEL632]|nr:hypothetical protein BJ741DRAFT_64664 [Chytriomyces cf. hyalinus JEL632]